MHVRIIPRLDIKGPNLVKGIHFEGLRVLGRPEAFARYYYEQSADELIYMDAVASLYQRNSLLPIVERTARELFIPLTVGGGLRTVDDIRNMLRAGADKCSINTAALANPSLIDEASRRFGSSTIVISIEAVKQSEGWYEAYTDYGRQRTGIDAMKWAVEAVERGAGELVVTSIDAEGTGRGFDLELTRTIAEAVPVPVIAAGGAGSAEDVWRVIAEGRADAVSIASILHYHAVRHIALCEDDYRDEGNIRFLRSGGRTAGFGRIRDVGLPELKRYLADREIHTRQTVGAQQAV